MRTLTVMTVAAAALAAGTTSSASNHATTPRVTRTAAARTTQLAVFEARYTHASSSGPPPSEVGHLQIASGRLFDGAGKDVGSFAATCRWLKILPHDDADEHCHGSANTPDGQITLAGPSRRSAPTHTWSIVAGSGNYRGATGTATVRDIGPLETIVALTVAPRVGTVVRSAVVQQPDTDAAFRGRADSLCAVARARLGKLPSFPFSNFDPLHPDATLLPKVGRFFSGPGDARPTLHRLERQLHALGAPPAANAEWARVLATQTSALEVRDTQIRAALAADADAFVASVHRVDATSTALGLAATVFGVDDCIF